MRSASRLMTLVAALLVTAWAVSGCSPDEGDKGKMGGGTMTSGKMDGAMDKGKMDGGAMETGKMDGAMEKGKMEGTPK